MYNIIRIYNKNNNNSYILVGKNINYKINENINNLSKKDHKSPILQKEFNEYKKQLKKEYNKNSLYKYINFTCWYLILIIIMNCWKSCKS